MRVGVTREGEGGRRLAELLATAGVEPVVVPLIRTAPPADGGDGLRRALAGLGPGDWLVVTSPNGAAAAVAEARSLGGVPVVAVGPLLGGVRVAAVGPSTADVLRRAGVDVEVVPDRYDAESLATELTRRAPAKAVVAVSALADDTVRSALADAGWDVHRVDAYRTEAVEPSTADRQALADCEVIALASGSAAEALVATGLRRPVVCLGQATARRSVALGLDVVAVARPSTLGGLVDAIVGLAGPS